MLHHGITRRPLCRRQTSSPLSLAGHFVNHGPRCGRTGNTARNLLALCNRTTVNTPRVKPVSVQNVGQIIRKMLHLQTKPRRCIRTRTTTQKNVRRVNKRVLKHDEEVLHFPVALTLLSNQATTLRHNNTSSTSTSNINPNGRVGRIKNLVKPVRNSTRRSIRVKRIHIRANSLSGLTSA